MSELVSSEAAPFIPDDLTVPQFFFDSDHALKATRPHGVPFFIDDASGRSVDSREVSGVVCLSSEWSEPSPGTRTSRWSRKWLEPQVGHK